VYTAEQATRGERTAYVNCFSCHTAADWTSSHFLDPDSEQRLGDLFQMISRQMPMDSPGKLSPAEYADVIAYMLKLQGPRAATKSCQETSASWTGSSSRVQAATDNGLAFAKHQRALRCSGEAHDDRRLPRLPRVAATRRATSA
jgi:hypothetical protein